MKETVRRIEQNNSKCFDIDAQNEFDFVAVAEGRKIICSAFETHIEIERQFYCVRQLNKEKFLLVDKRTNGREYNAWVIDNKGQVINAFMAGDGIEDIVIQTNKIVISYFDEGIFGYIQPGEQGLVVFDFNGNILFKYHDSYGHIVDIAHCYSMCPKGKKTVLFSVYDEFPLIELNLDTYSQTIHKPPEKLNGSSSITSSGSDIFFHAPYLDKRGIYKWSIGNENTEKVGEYTPYLRGLSKGRFLSRGDYGYTIIDLNE